MNIVSKKLMVIVLAGIIAMGIVVQSMQGMMVYAHPVNQTANGLNVQAYSMGSCWASAASLGYAGAAVKSLSNICYPREGHSRATELLRTLHLTGASLLAGSVAYMGISAIRTYA